MNAPRRLTRPVARASVPSNMSKTPPAKTTRPPTSQSWLASRIAPTAVIAEPDEREPVRRQPQPAEGERDRLAELLEPATRLVGDRHPGVLSSRPAGRSPARARSRAATSSNAPGRREQMVSRPTRRVTTRPASRSRLRWWLTRGWDSPTWSISSVTVDGVSARRRTMRSRFTSASARWNVRRSRRSSGWSTIEASVPRIRAGEGDRMRLQGVGLGAFARRGTRLNTHLYKGLLILESRARHVKNRAVATPAGAPAA